MYIPYMTKQAQAAWFLQVSSNFDHELLILKVDFYELSSSSIIHDKNNFQSYF